MCTLGWFSTIFQRRQLFWLPSFLVTKPFQKRDLLWREEPTPFVNMGKKKKIWAASLPSVSIPLKFSPIRFCEVNSIFNYTPESSWTYKIFVMCSGSYLSLYCLISLNPSSQVWLSGMPHTVLYPACSEVNILHMTMNLLLAWTMRPDLCWI